MKAEIWGTTEVKEHPKHECQANLVLIETTDVEASRGIGAEHIATVDVTRDDGKRSRFFVAVYVDQNGRAWGEITANKTDSETRKRVAGVWLDYSARKREALERSDNG
jgi:hypothetical protein